MPPETDPALSAWQMVLHYRDDGPSGPCGQDTRTTSPWSRLLVYNNEGDATAFMRLIKDKPSFAGRRRPRIEAYWFEDQVDVGPVVPEAERV